MFDRLIRWSEAKRALRAHRYEEALRLLGDPLVREDRRAADLRERACEGLVTRACQRLDQQEFAAARHDLDLVQRTAGVGDVLVGRVEELRAELSKASAAHTTVADQAADLWRRGRQLAQQGDLSAAEQAGEQAFELQGDAVERDALTQLIASRREHARVHRAAVNAALTAGDPIRAKGELGRARAADREAPDLPKLARRVAEAVGRDLIERLRGESSQREMLVRVRSEAAELPELEGFGPLRDLVAKARSAEHDAIAGELAAGRLESALRRFQAATDGHALDPDTDLALGCAALEQGFELQRRGDLVGAVAALDSVPSGFGRSTGCSRVLSRLRKDWDKERDQIAGELASAQAAVVDGRLGAAREQLVALLERWPLNESARRELDGLERGSHERAQRLASAREYAAEGRLQAAYDLALTQAAPGETGTEARLLLKDLQARLDVVRSGVDQVRRALHGRSSNHRDGLRHCVLRLEQLALVQSDSAEIESLKGSLESEIEGLDALEAGAVALRTEQASEFRTAVLPLAEIRSRLSSENRLDARRLELADRVLTKIDVLVQGGRLTAAERWIDGVRVLVVEDAAARDRLQLLTERVDERKRIARQRIDDGLAALQRRAVDDAEDALADARSEWVDGAPVERLAGELQVVDRRMVDVTAIEDMAAAKDFAGAHQKLADMDPTPPLLRTRMFDLKQNLARAQGLEGAFVLRVDEGGEFLVVRGESVTIGNVRDGQADLPVLARLAGCHARITRSMSFHGGMQDRITAERGELFVRERSVPDHKLTPGDSVRLGQVLGLRYGVPCRRSLTAALSLTGGFQVGGTDKVLLFKDRGRDGRIVIGSGPDVHVPVPVSGPEIELFATKDGQLRVACEAGGEIDGKPFAGEHPVPAGALVKCGEVVFLVQPWNRER